MPSYEGALLWRSLHVPAAPPRGRELRQLARQADDVADDRGGATAAQRRAEAKRWRAEAQALDVEAHGQVVRARRELALRIDQAETYARGPAQRAAELQRRVVIAYQEGDRPILELLDVYRGARDAELRVLWSCRVRTTSSSRRRAVRCRDMAMRTEPAPGRRA